MLGESQGAHSGVYMLSKCSSTCQDPRLYLIHPTFPEAAASGHEPAVKEAGERGFAGGFDHNPQQTPYVFFHKGK